MTPGLARAQLATRFARLAVVHPLAAVDRLTTSGSPRYRALFDQLSRRGFVEGKNLEVRRWSGEGRSDLFSALAGKVVETGPDAILTTTTPLGRAFQAATQTIPIVAITADPVAMGFAANLARPGSNVTGISIDSGLAIVGKRVELIRELVPSMRRLGYLARAGSWGEPDGLFFRELCAQYELLPVDTSVTAPFDEPAYGKAFAAMEGRVDALCIAAQAENAINQQLIATLALKARLATVFDTADNVEVGGLISYGIDFADVYRQAADLTAKILAGTPPQQLPFLQPTRFELSINQATARQLGLTVPTSLLARADNLVD